MSGRVVSERKICSITADYLGNFKSSRAFSLEEDSKYPRIADLSGEEILSVFKKNA